MRLRTALLAMTAMVTAPSLARATVITGPYIEGGAGYDLVQNQHARLRHYDTTKTNGNPHGMLRHGTGYMGFGSAGWGFGNGLRIEAEGMYDHSTINRVGVHRNGAGNVGIGHSTGHDQGYGGFVNVIYDIDPKLWGPALFGTADIPVTPFVGVGAGYMWQQYSNIRAKGGAMKGPNFTTRHNSTSAGSFAYQGIVGLSYDILGVPGLQIAPQYRFMSQKSSSGFGNYHYNNMFGPAGNPDGRSRMRFNNRYNHMFILSLRYAFNSAPPPPPAAPHVAVPPAPAPARTYLVFFDWNSDSLTPRAREIVAQAAQASTHVQTTRIQVNGYTDTSHAGSAKQGAAYNMKMSVRRAETIKAELVRDGVPATAIDIHGYGDAHLLVPTGPNVRDAQNRRVEIILEQ